MSGSFIFHMYEIGGSIIEQCPNTLSIYIAKLQIPTLNVWTKRYCNHNRGYSEHFSEDFYM